MVTWILAFIIAFMVIVVWPMIKSGGKNEAYERGRKDARERRGLSDAYERGFKDGSE